MINTDIVYGYMERYYEFEERVFESELAEQADDFACDAESF